MSVLKIYGWGKWLLLNELDESTAKTYAESGSISDSDNSELEDESDSYAFGFNPDAMVIVDDKEIGTVIDVLDKSKGTDRYEFITKNISKSEIDNLQNAWLKEETYKGTFVEVDIEDDCVDKNGVTDKFYERFVENIQVVDSYLFYMPLWKGTEVFEDDIDGKSSEFYVKYDGEIYELNIEEE